MGLLLQRLGLLSQPRPGEYSRIQQDGGGVSISGSTVTLITWDTTIFGPNRFYNPNDADVGANGFKVPTGITHVEVRVSTSMADITNGKIYNVRIHQGASTIVAFGPKINNATSSIFMNATTGIIAVNEGDYFTAHIWHNHSSARLNNDFTYGNFFEILNMSKHA